MSPDLHHLSGAYAVDALDEDERASFEQHLVECADCRAEVAELSATAHALSSITEATPPASLRDSVLSRISRVRPLPPLVGGDAGAPVSAESPGSVVPPTAEPAADPSSAGTVETGPPVVGERGREASEGPGGTVVPMRRRATTWFAVAAAAALIAIGGLAWSPWSDDSASTSAVARVTAAADAMRVSSTKGPLTAEVAYSRQLGKAAIDVKGLPPAPEGKTYQLWYVGNDQVARSAGLLTADAEGNGSMVLQGDPNAAAAVGMTVEPAGGSARPTTDPLVVLTLA